MANMPKFKAHPLNKKILHASSLPPPIPRSTPHPPQLKVYVRETPKRAPVAFVSRAETF
ncbi:hypothetical protein PIB30_047691, partial [Stylosanthes scabra]|nr:hypothetical protein [Stylosanthes scabra]